MSYEDGEPAQVWVKPQSENSFHLYAFMFLLSDSVPSFSSRLMVILWMCTLHAVCQRTSCCQHDLESLLIPKF
jgi:hypothetical protein